MSDNKNTNTTNKNSNLTNKNTNLNANKNTTVNRNKNINTNKNTNVNKNKNLNTNKNTNKNANANKNVVKKPSKPWNPFTDVKNGKWYYGAVKWSYENSLLTGYEGTTLFGPNDNLTRGQAAVILWRWFEPETAYAYKESNGRNQTPFADNLNGKYYTGAMNWAYKQGIFTGYEGTNLVGVYDSLTRQQMCTVMYRCATKLSKNSGNYQNTKFNAFPDVFDVSGYAKTGMAWCVDKGVISGWDNKFLAPQMTIDRAQMSQIMMNAVTKKIIR